MLIYGRNPILFRLNNAKKIMQAFLQEGFKDQAVLSALNVRGVPFEYVSKKSLDSMVGFDHQGVVAEINNYPYQSLEEAVLKSNTQAYPTFVILDGIEDPHNFGAIVRTAEAAGVSAIIIPSNRSVEVNPTVYKTSTGAVDNMIIIKVVNLSRAIEFLKDNGFWIVGLEGSSNQDYRDIDYLMKTAVVIGSEGNGISRLVKEKCDFLIKLPMRGKVNSLNASNAAAIILYHILSCH